MSTVTPSLATTADLKRALALLRHTGRPGPLLRFLNAFERARGREHVLAGFYRHLVHGDADDMPDIDPAFLSSILQALDFRILRRGIDEIITGRHTALLALVSAHSIEELLSDEN